MQKVVGSSPIIRSKSSASVLLLFVLARYALRGRSVSSFPFLASALAIFSGVQLLTLGLMGEYFARIHMRTMNRPPYSIHEEVGAPATSERHALR